MVMVIVQLGYARRVHVQTQRWEMPSEGGCDRQPHVAQSDHGDADFVSSGQGGVHRVVLSSMFHIGEAVKTSMFAVPVPARMAPWISARLARATGWRRSLADHTGRCRKVNQ